MLEYILPFIGGALLGFVFSDLLSWFEANNIKGDVTPESDEDDWNYR